MNAPILPGETTLQIHLLDGLMLHVSLAHGGKQALRTVAEFVVVAGMPYAQASTLLAGVMFALAQAGLLTEAEAMQVAEEIKYDKPTSTKPRVRALLQVPPALGSN